MADGGRQGSAWSPFRHGTFVVLWTATVVSNTGTWMNDVGAGWLMTTLSPSPLMVALVQTATTLPVFLFALPAGALADIVDRRRLLIVVQALLAIAVALFTALVWSGWATAPVLLVFTFLLGAGAAFVAPAWQAIVPKLVPKPDLQAAVALNGVGINISRAIGPALAGFLIVGFGIAAPFAVNALSFLGVIAALVWWRTAPATANGKRVSPACSGWSSGCSPSNRRTRTSSTACTPRGCLHRQGRGPQALRVRLQGGDRGNQQGGPVPRRQRPRGQPLRRPHPAGHPRPSRGDERRRHSARLRRQGLQGPTTSRVRPRSSSPGEVGGSPPNETRPQATVVEPMIGHAKNDGRLGRNHLLGHHGDKINALLAASNQKSIAQPFLKADTLS